MDDDDLNTDTILLDSLESMGAFVVNDESGNFAVVSAPADLPDSPGHDISITVRVPAESWRSSLREAIEAFIQEDII